MNFDMKLSNYYKPTPVKMRKLGDALLATAIFIVAGGMWTYDEMVKIFTPNEVRAVMGIAFLAGGLGKFLTNFAKDPKANDDNSGK